MSVGDLPAMASSMHSSTAYAGTDFMVPANLIGQASMGSPIDFDFGKAIWSSKHDREDAFVKAIRQHQFEKRQQHPQEVAAAAIQEALDMGTFRVVQVFIADPNENIPLDQRMLYIGAVTPTDLTDQELFFELDIKKMLDAHNEKRTKIVDKRIKDRTEYLEAAKVRDLKMVVTNIAQF